MGSSLKFWLVALMATTFGSMAAFGANSSAPDCAAPDIQCQASTTDEDNSLSALAANLLDVTGNNNDDMQAASKPPNHWQLSLTPALENPGSPTDIASKLTDVFAVALNEYAGESKQRINHTQTISGVDALLRSLSETRANTNKLGVVAPATADNLMANLVKNAGNLRISATMPVTSSQQMQASEQELQAAINSDEVTLYLAQHNDIAMLLAKMLGWESTGLLPSAADVQKMASAHLTAIANSVEGWALNNVSFSSSTIALANSDDDNAMVQWQWQVNNSHYGSGNTGALSDSTLRANLRAMFGVAEY